MRTIAVYSSQEGRGEKPLYFVNRTEALRRVRAAEAKVMRPDAVRLLALDRCAGESAREITLAEVETALDARGKLRRDWTDVEQRAAAKLRLWPFTGIPALRHAQ